MARLLYSLLLYSMQPLIALRLLWRSYHQPEYRKNLAERYGFYRQQAQDTRKKYIWLHAVSLGETNAAAPLIAALLEHYPQHALLLTHMTPTGRTAGKAYLKLYPNRILQTYLPYDLPGATKRFLAHFRPEIGLLMETEIWPNLIYTAERRGIPLALINARLSQRSQQRYQKLAPLARPAFSTLHGVAAQTATDAERIQTLGAKNIHVTGNLKFDLGPDAEKQQLGQYWRQKIGGRPIWLAASTREGEEALILDAYTQINIPELLLVIVPRHPQRFNHVAQQIQQSGLSNKRRSREELPTSDTKIWLGDSMGEMAAYYTLADLAFIGGTLQPYGGQNLIEAAACGCPILIGPHTFNFAQASEDALACGAARRIDSENPSSALSTTIADILRHPEQHSRMQKNALQFSRNHRGASQRTLQLITSLMAATKR